MGLKAVDLKHELIERALEAGFDDIRITTPDKISDAKRGLEYYLKQGRHGDMLWMAANSDRRGDPAILWPEVRSIIMLAMNYGPDTDPLCNLQEPSTGTISVYARGQDYHDILKKRLKRIAGWLYRESGNDVKVFVDTAPVMEKPLSQAAGLGWQGKHTNLVSRSFGSWLFLGSIFTTAEIEADSAEIDHCGNCRKCLDICPTDAFPKPYQLDSRRCISYLTIEHKGHIAREFRKPMGNRIYGCDDCLAICPWNKFARIAQETRFRSSARTNAPTLKDLLNLDEKNFRQLYSGSPIKRTGRDRFIRNVLIAAGNSDDPTLVHPVRNLLKDPSPLVRAMAVWAFDQLSDRTEFERLRKIYLPSESDPDVKREWLGN